MAKYSGVRRSITPNTSNDNWTLVAGANESAKVIEFHWGGETTTSTAMNTRIARSASGTTPSNGNVAKLHPNHVTNVIDFVASWSAQPTPDSGDLWCQSWNAHGGVVRWLAAPGEEFVLLASANISCRNANGTATSTYGVIWEED